MVRVAGFAISADGYGAGSGQELDHPLGRGGKQLHDWFFPTRTFQQRVAGADEGTLGIDNDFAARGFQGVGAWILGRNMFGPFRGPWRDHTWQGWWGPAPPFQTPVFVLTHYERPSLAMEGGTIFHFVCDGVEAALERARDAAEGGDIRIGGGVATLRAYLRAGLIDEAHFAISPVLLGCGEAVFADLDLPALGYGIDEHVAGEAALHLTVRRRTLLD